MFIILDDFNRTKLIHELQNLIIVLAALTCHWFRDLINGELGLFFTIGFDSLHNQKHE